MKKSLKPKRSPIKKSVAPPNSLEAAETDALLSVDELQRSYQEAFREFGIEHFPVYTNPDDFARRFERCSLLKSDNIIFTMTSSASTPVLKSKA